jgi:hypothetical protein
LLAVAVAVEFLLQVVAVAVELQLEQFQHLLVITQ